MISAESTKMCSCMSVTPSSAGLMGPATVLTVVKRFLNGTLINTGSNLRRIRHEKSTCILYSCRGTGTGRRGHVNRFRAVVSGGTIATVQEGFPGQHRRCERRPAEIQSFAHVMVYRRMRGTHCSVRGFSVYD